MCFSFEKFPAELLADRAKVNRILPYHDPAR